ncbi:MAG: hypothetical protein IPG54_13620 [Sphingomonadales bacterium]|nr:hypothetical protein [Sphingomonadales bacterium]
MYDKRKGAKPDLDAYGRVKGCAMILAIFLSFATAAPDAAGLPGGV